MKRGQIVTEADMELIAIRMNEKEAFVTKEHKELVTWKTKKGGTGLFKTPFVLTGRGREDGRMRIIMTGDLLELFDHKRRLHAWKEDKTGIRRANKELLELASQ
jgi:hypothetical protein